MAQADDKKRARLNVISHLLSQIPFEPVETKKVTLPERVVGSDAKPTTGVQPRYIPTPF